MRLVDGLNLVRSLQIIEADSVKMTILSGLDDLGSDLQ